MSRTSPGRLGALLLASLLARTAGSQEPKKEPPDPKPRIVVAMPLQVSPAATSLISLQGSNLDRTTEVRFAEPVQGASIAIKSKGKVVPSRQMNPLVYGDTKVDLEIKLPDKVEKVSLIVVNAAGQTAPHELVVLAKGKVVLEKEPNGAFATAQPVDAGKTVQGAVSQEMDVDVFRISGKKGETWIFEVEAKRHGSILDSMLTLLDKNGEFVAMSDDTGETRDSLLRVTLPADGPYLLTVLDAHNAGSAAHPYLLHLRRDN